MKRKNEITIRSGAAELICSRAYSAKDNMGLTSWKNSSDGLIYKYDVVVE